MSPHKVTGDWKRGFTLVMATVLFWATLPLALKLSMRVVDPITLTWLRFVVAFVVTAAVQLPKRGLAPWRGLGGRHRLLLATAAVMLVLNYVLYISGLHLTTPGNAQVLIQLAPVFMTLGGLIVFKERFNLQQWLGFASLVVGLGLFSYFRRGPAEASAVEEHAALGVALITVAAATWAAYALAQKALLSAMTAQQVMLSVYLVGSVCLLPFVHPAALLDLDAVGVAAVAYCALNTLGAYSAFAESMNHWEASRISTVLAITPLGTLSVVAVCHALWPELVPPEPMTALAWVGALLVVVGSATSALAKQTAPALDD